MPEELTDEAGEIVWECSYQLWGKPIQEIAHTEIQQNLRYQGQYLDRETGLHYNTFRYYDPDTGRFTQPDPIGLAGGLNLYQYAPNAFMWIDPWGLSCSSDAAELHKNMQNLGIPESKYKNSAHHIVMSNSKDWRMVKLREKMDSFKIGINEGINGAYLPTSSKVKAPAHSKIHTNEYKQNTYDRLINIDNATDFKKELQNIGKEISEGKFKF